MNISYADSCLLLKDQINKTCLEMDPYLTHLKTVDREENHASAESSINLPDDQKASDAVIGLVKQKCSKNLKYVVIVGIGGSYLGTKAIYDALSGYFDQIEPVRFPKIYFSDTCDPEQIAKLVEFLQVTITSPDEILINIISKSGSTTETIVNSEIILSALKNKYPNIEKRVVITSDVGSKLWQVAISKGIDTLAIPKSVGGRYSVFSPVGLFPLAAVGINIPALLTGAREMKNRCLVNNDNNPALISATILFLHSKKGLNINDNFFFHPELESLGKWYRQLMGESIGKNNLGITPTISIGSNDLHSVGQLYLAGPKDKITMFVNAKPKASKLVVPEKIMLADLVKNIEGKTPAQIMSAIYQGNQSAYKNQILPFFSITLDGIDEKSLGEFMQYKMIEMMLLAQLMKVNAFDQPQVELYKTETKKILALKVV